MSIKFSQLPVQSSITGTITVPITGVDNLSYKTTIDSIGSYILSTPVITGGSINNAPIGLATPAASKFTSIAIPTETSTATLEKNTGISSWVYAGINKSVTTEESVPTGLFFNSTGTKMYVAGSSGDDVNEYTLSSAWNVSTATYSTVFSVASQDSAQADIYFKPDGTGFYVVGDTNNTVFQYTLGTPWSISTASYASKSFSVGTQETNPSGIWFKPDGTEMYVLGYATDAIYKYILATPWDVSTAYYSNISFNISGQESGGNALVFNDTGTSFFVTGSTGDDINQWNMSTPWDITTATFVDRVWFGFYESTVTAMYIAFGQNKAYVLGSGSDAVFQYNTISSSLKLTVENFYLTGYTRTNDLVVNNNFTVEGGSWFGGSAYFGNANVYGTLNATSTITLSGATTSTTTLGTGATTGTTSIGGTTQTGSITVGQSTAAQTLNLATGATANATTKTINIGTAGVSGSTTNINIGSAVSGALGTVTFNSKGTIYSISPAVTAAGSQQNEALLLTSTINNIVGSVVGANGVLMPVAVIGLRILVRNGDVSDSLLIYPQVGTQINSLGANIPYSLPAGQTAEFFATTATQWYSF